MNQKDQECCPEFHKEKWDKKSYEWQDKLFIKETISTLFHIPFPPSIGKKITKMYQMVEKSEANIPDKTEALILFRDPSAFRSKIYYAVTKPVEGANNTSITGSFIAGVFDGAFNNVSKYIKEMDKYLQEKSLSAKDYYIHYAYCPKCAKERGHNYMILFAKI